MIIFCSGIGGIGLSALAAIRKLRGDDVHGSDRSESALLDDLRSQGLHVTTDQSGVAIPAGCKLLIYSEAIPPEAPERQKATELGIRQISYPEALGEMTAGYRSIAVCGTHGKSSTTAMSARLLIEAGLDPTVVVGTKLKELGGRNWRVGKSDLFVLEACEYKRSFRFYKPEVILLTNADGDHFDYYTSAADYRAAFDDFVATVPPNGALITHMQDPDCIAIAQKSGKRIIDADGFPMITLHTPGVHMQKNAQLALGLAAYLKIPTETAQTAVGGYAGSWRRLEVKGMYKGSIPVIDDYAHHPAELKATISAIRSAYPDKRLVAVFQPHTHDRTNKLYADFVTAFPGVDLLFLTDVYDARKEYNTKKVNMPRFVGDISRESNVATGWTGTLDQTRERLASELQDNDVLLCMGAGDITNLAGKIATS